MADVTHKHHTAADLLSAIYVENSVDCRENKRKVTIQTYRNFSKLVISYSADMKI